MSNEAQQETYGDEISIFMRDSIKVWQTVEASMPESMVHLRDRLEGLQISVEPVKSISKNSLFYRIGNILSHDGYLTMGELSCALVVPFSTATRIVDGLVGNGYVERLSDPDDKRVVRITLTESGRQLYEAIDDYVAKHIMRILSTLTAKERDTFLKLFHKVADSF